MRNKERTIIVHTYNGRLISLQHWQYKIQCGQYYKCSSIHNTYTWATAAWWWKWEPLWDHRESWKECHGVIYYTQFLLNQQSKIKNKRINMCEHDFPFSVSVEHIFFQKIANDFWVVYISSTTQKKVTMKLL